MAFAIILIAAYPIVDRFLGYHLSNTPDSVQRVRVLAMALYSYGKDHGDKYPTGNSSTDIFQKLLDGHYLPDAGAVFDPSYAVDGKIKAATNVLKPANVCWDVTVPADAESPDALPLVFETGFRVAYAPKGSATPLSSTAIKQGKIAVAYSGLNAVLLKRGWIQNGIIPNFVSSQFDAKGVKYVQLTPDGPLP